MRLKNGSGSGFCTNKKKNKRNIEKEIETKELRIQRTITKRIRKRYWQEGRGVNEKIKRQSCGGVQRKEVLNMDFHLQ